MPDIEMICQKYFASSKCLGCDNRWKIACKDQEKEKTQNELLIEQHRRLQEKNLIL